MTDAPQSDYPIRLEDLANVDRSDAPDGSVLTRQAGRWAAAEPTGGGGGGGIPTPGNSLPVNQQAVLIGANAGGNDVTAWLTPEPGQLLYGHESAGLFVLDPTAPGDVLTLDEDNLPSWQAPATGAVAADNRQYYYVDTAGHGAINSGDAMPQDWTYYGDISTPPTDPNTITETGIQIGQAGWYAIHAVFTVFFNGAGRAEAALRVGGMLFSREKTYKPPGQDDIDTEVALAVFGLVYVAAEVQVLTDVNVTLATGTWGLSDARLIMHRLA